MGSALNLWFFWMAIFASLLTARQAFSQDILQPLIGGDSVSEMSVTTHKIKKDKKDKVDPHQIRLVSPNPNSQFTPGTIAFSWKLNSATKEQKVMFVLEKLETHRIVSQPWKGESLSLNLKTGTYRWQVVTSNPKAESHWRSFEIISTTGGPLKNVPELTVDNPVSDPGQENSHVEQFKSPGSNVNSQDQDIDDKKLQEYKQEKIKSEQLAKDLKNQLEVVKKQRLQALETAKKEVAQLKAARQARYEAEKAAKERQAKVEADRLAKIQAEKAAKEKIVKLRAKQIKEIRLAKEKADLAAQKLMAMIKKENEAKLEAEKATRELAAKVEKTKQVSHEQENNQDQGESDEVKEEDLAAQENVVQPTRVPSSNPSPKQEAPAPQPPHRSSGDDLKWSDE